MILPFSQYFDKEKKKPTFFAGKINACLLNDESIVPKLHTIRFDIKDRWKQGNKIHAVYNNRSKSQYQITPVFLCKGVQKIKITYTAFEDMKWPLILIDGVPIRAKKIEMLAINDGFDSAADFLAWFNTDFEGKIIHFTDLRY